MKFTLPVLIAFLFLILSPLHSQEGWRRLTIKNGLSANGVHDIIQTTSNDVWIGTDRGIDHYNGIAQRTKLRSDNQKVDAFLVTGSETLFARSVSIFTLVDEDNKHKGQTLITTLWYFDGERWNRDPISDKIGLNRLSDWPISTDDRFAVHKTGKLGLLPGKG